MTYLKSLLTFCHWLNMTVVKKVTKLITSKTMAYCSTFVLQ